MRVYDLIEIRDFPWMGGDQSKITHTAHAQIFAKTDPLGIIAIKPVWPPYNEAEIVVINKFAL
jgi:hypothetical protein